MNLYRVTNTTSVHTSTEEIDRLGADIVVEKDVTLDELMMAETRGQARFDFLEWLSDVCRNWDSYGRMLDVPVSVRLVRRGVEGTRGRKLSWWVWDEKSGTVVPMMEGAPDNDE